MADRVDVLCPCCSTRLVVDTDTGEILSEVRPKVDHEKNFDQAVSDMRQGERRRDEAFSKAFDKTRKLDDLLEKKFEEARKKAKDDDSAPRRPFDFD